MPTVAATKLDGSALKEAGRFGGVGVASGHLANMGKPSLPMGRLAARRKARQALREDRTQEGAA